MKRKPTQRVLDLRERDTRVPVRVSQEEKRRFLKLAEAKHTNLSELIRLMLHAEADKELGREKREAA